MCGIAGIISTDAVVDPGLIVRMRDSLRHRGPDDEGVWTSDDRTVALGHRRLAVIDLSPGGHQPMSDRTGRYHVVFNGEIYNYLDLRDELCRRGRQFRTASDTEVLLEAYAEWGPDCLSRLNGMFAFAMYDVVRRQAFAARDRAGEKPLFYRHAGGRLAFASELKALMVDPACPRVLDRDALEAYLAFGYVPSDRCILKGVRKLPQGHALLYDVAQDAARVWRYWSLPEHDPCAEASAGELVDELERLLEDSVRRRLIADVPVGVMLSGGIDSSLVTAVAARVASKRIKTFTVSFPGHGSFDEAPHAREVARHFDTDHVELVARPATVDLLPTLAAQYDEPMADSSMVPTYLVSQLIRAEATVALGGDGGDELFGGYPHHSWVQSQQRLRSLVPSVLRGPARAAAERILPLGVKGRNYLLGLTADGPLALAQFNIYFDGPSRHRLLAPLGASASTPPEAIKAALWRSGRTPVQQATMLDFQTYLVDDILVKVDRASMLCALEVRAPWLDPRLIDLAFRRVPDHLRATASERKVLPRMLAARLLPPSLDLYRKQGFSLPLHAWFKGEWGAAMRDTLTQADGQVFDRAAVCRLIAGQERGFSNVQRVFALTMFELWRQHYRISVG